MALDNDLDVFPVINKIDLPSANIDGTRQEIEEEYNTRNKIFDEEEIYSVAHSLQWTMFDAILKGV